MIVRRSWGTMYRAFTAFVIRHSSFFISRFCPSWRRIPQLYQFEPHAQPLRLPNLTALLAEIARGVGDECGRPKRDDHIRAARCRGQRDAEIADAVVVGRKRAGLLIAEEGPHRWHRQPAREPAAPVGAQHKRLGRADTRTGE